MKLSTLYNYLMSVALIFTVSMAVQAEEYDGSRQGVQNAMDQHDKNISRYNENHPDKAIPKGLEHSRAVLERVRTAERPELPDVTMRPERPELPDVAMRPQHPERPAKPDGARR